MLTDPKKNKGAGIPPSFSTKIGQEWSTDDMYCKNLHVVPNKLIGRRSAWVALLC